jgi:hypothetical protein
VVLPRVGEICLLPESLFANPFAKSAGAACLEDSGSLQLDRPQMPRELAGLLLEAGDARGGALVPEEGPARGLVDEQDAGVRFPLLADPDLEPTGRAEWDLAHKFTPCPGVIHRLGYPPRSAHAVLSRGREQMQELLPSCVEVFIKGERRATNSNLAHPDIKRLRQGHRVDKERLRTMLGLGVDHHLVEVCLVDPLGRLVLCVDDATSLARSPVVNDHVNSKIQTRLSPKDNGLLIPKQKRVRHMHSQPLCHESLEKRRHLDQEWKHVSTASVVSGPAVIEKESAECVQLAVVVVQTIVYTT